MHGHGDFDRSRDRSCQVWRDGVRGGSWEERDAVPFYADVDEGGRCPVPVSVCEIANTWPRAVRLLEPSVLGDVRKLVTHRFTIEDAVSAFETSADPKSEAIKVQITNHKL